MADRTVRYTGPTARIGRRVSTEGGVAYCLPSPQAQRLVEAGVAEYVDEEKHDEPAEVPAEAPSENASMQPAETAAVAPPETSPVETVTADKAEEAEEGLAEDGEEEEYVCNICGYTSATAGGLGSHRRVHRSE